MALRWTIARAAESGVTIGPVRVHAMSAWNVPLMTPVGMAGAATSVNWTEVERSVADRLAAVVEAEDHRGVPVTTEVVRGGAAHALLEAASGADLLVVGSRGLAGFKELVLGSVSRQCATHAPVPTVVVPRSAPLGPVGKIVVGFDGSDHAVAALRWTLEVAAVTMPTAVIHAVGAFEISPFTDPELTRARFADEVREAEADFHHRIDALDPDHRCGRSFSLRGARRALAEAADGADLVVLGARGRGTIGAALLGSVSTWMLHNTPCAMVIVPD